MKKNAISVLETLLQTMGEYPVIAHVLSGTNILYDCVEVVAEATGRDPGEIMRGLRERNRERMRELSIRQCFPMTALTRNDCGRMVVPSPITVLPSRYTFGYSVTSCPSTTSGPI